MPIALHHEGGDTYRLDIKGFGTSEAWSNLDFYARHGDAIHRIAIVGNEQWRDESLMFAAADLRKAPVRYFVETDLARARQWLAS